MDKATVVCVLKTGGEYTAEYVDRLYSGCMQHGADDFICITDDSEVNDICSTMPLLYDLPGWWSKLEMFRLDPGKFLYLDLDTVVVSDITDILEYPHRFTMLRDFNARANRSASGVMAWQGNFAYLLTGFSTDQIPKYDPRQGGKLGDQVYISDHLRTSPDHLQDIFPGSAVSYKWSTEEQRRSSQLVCYHGRPRPHETGWRY